MEGETRSEKAFLLSSRMSMILPIKVPSVAASQLYTAWDRILEVSEAPRCMSFTYLMMKQILHVHKATPGSEDVLEATFIHSGPLGHD